MQVSGWLTWCLWCKALHTESEGRLCHDTNTEIPKAKYNARPQMWCCTEHLHLHRTGLAPTVHRRLLVPQPSVSVQGFDHWAGLAVLIVVAAVTAAVMCISTCSRVVGGSSPDGDAAVLWQAGRGHSLFLFQSQNDQTSTEATVWSLWGPRPPLQLHRGSAALPFPVWESLFQPSGGAFYTPRLVSFLHNFCRKF